MGCEASCSLYRFHFLYCLLFKMVIHFEIETLHLLMNTFKTCFLSFYRLRIFTIKKWCCKLLMGLGWRERERNLLQIRNRNSRHLWSTQNSEYRDYSNNWRKYGRQPWEQHRKVSLPNCCAWTHCISSFIVLKWWEVQDICQKMLTGRLRHRQEHGIMLDLEEIGLQDVEFLKQQAAVCE